MHALTAFIRYFNMDLQYILLDIVVKEYCSWSVNKINVHKFVNELQDLLPKKAELYTVPEDIWSNVPAWEPHQHDRLSPGNSEASTEGSNISASRF